MKNIDIVVVQKLANLLNKYILFRQRSLDKNSDYNWNKLFIADGDKFVHEIDDQIKINLYRDSILSRLIYQGFEDVEKYFITNFINPGDIFLDIGANIGLHTLIAGKILKQNGRIYAFEPTPVTYARLLENIGKNDLTETVTAVQAGLSDKNELLNFNISKDGHDAWNSFANLKHVNLDTQIQINVLTADQFVSDQQIKTAQISLIKIDVEGWEIKVMQGMTGLFADHDFAPCFLVEFTEENMFRAGYSCKQLYEFMLSKGYQWFSYDPKTNNLIPAELKAYYPYENLIATKDPEQVNRKLNKVK